MFAALRARRARLRAIRRYLGSIDEAHTALYHLRHSVDPHQRGVILAALAGVEDRMAWEYDEAYGVDDLVHVAAGHRQTAQMYRLLANVEHAIDRGRLRHQGTTRLETLAAPFLDAMVHQQRITGTVLGLLCDRLRTADGPRIDPNAVSALEALPLAPTEGSST